MEYQTIKSKELASGVQAGCKSGVKLDFEDVCHVKSMQILTTDTKISETVNVPKVSPKYLLILFRNASEVDNEKYENPGVKSIRLDYEGDSNVIYQNRLKEPELHNEARRVFGKGELSTITKADFFKNKFCICLDLRTHQGQSNSWVRCFKYHFKNTIWIYGSYGIKDGTEQQIDSRHFPGQPRSSANSRKQLTEDFCVRPCIKFVHLKFPYGVRKFNLFHIGKCRIYRVFFSSVHFENTCKRGIPPSIKIPLPVLNI